MYIYIFYLPVCLAVSLSAAYSFVNKCHRPVIYHYISKISVCRAQSLSVLMHRCIGYSVQSILSTLRVMALN